MARILVIDDDVDVRAVLEEALKVAGHEVVLAADGEEGLKRYLSAPADLVITDLFMPNQEGVETIIKLRRNCPEIPIIAISGNPLASTMLAVARKLGAITVLHKPFDLDQALLAIDKALGLEPKSPA